MLSRSTVVGTLCIVLPIVFLSLSIRSVGAEVKYSVTDLGPLTGTNRAVVDINDNGQVVGISNGRNFLYNGTLPVQDLGSSGNSTRLGLNNAGQVGLHNGAIGHAAMYSGGVMYDLGSLGGTSWACSINASGQVACSSYLYNPTFTEHACVYIPGSGLQDLGSILGWSATNNMNDLGQVVGYDWNSSLRIGIVYTPGIGLQTTPSLGGTFTMPMDINNSGQIVGVGSNTSNQRHPFYITDGTIRDLGTFGGTEGWCMGINDQGQSVGFAMISSGVHHGFYYDGTNPMVDLNTLIDPTSGWTINEGDAINNRGQITGNGTFGGVMHAFILTPVPEPGTFVVLGVGVAVLLRRRRTCVK
jgi:probable HAF family extracellular repeat protein